MNFNFWAHWLFPNRCVCCSTVIYASQQLCEDCEPRLPWIGPDECPACGHARRDCVCGGRRRTSFPCVSAFYYEGVAKEGLLTLKGGETTHGLAFFARHAADKVRAVYGGQFDGIVYVPMTRAATWERGYNQSRLLAKAMGKVLDLPVLDKALVRLYDTPDQHRSGAATRKGNVFGVFEADPALVANKHLLLVDDIITTGATMEECGKMLLLAGCEEVAGVTVASTKRKEDEAPAEPAV